MIRLRNLQVLSYDNDNDKSYLDSSYLLLMMAKIPREHSCGTKIG